MPEKCKSCGAKIIKFPLWKGQEREEPFRWDKMIWLNLFKVDAYSIVFIALIVFMVIGYKADIKQCEDVIEKPCEFCEKSNCCQIDWSKLDPQKQVERQIVDIRDIPEVNITKMR